MKLAKSLTSKWRKS